MTDQIPKTLDAWLEREGPDGSSGFTELRDQTKIYLMSRLIAAEVIRRMDKKKKK